MARISRQNLASELARRKFIWYRDEDFRTIKCFGLFMWGEVSHHLKKNLITTNYTKENKTIWVNPTEKFYNDEVLPIVKDLENGILSVNEYGFIVKP